MNNFIEKLKTISSDEELRKIINEKGKPRKIVPGLVYEDNREKINVAQYNK